MKIFGTMLVVGTVALMVSQPIPSAGSTDTLTTEFDRARPIAHRPVRWFSGDRWIGFGVAYGPHRDGQRPGGPSPSKEELREDLHIMSQHWSLLRVYGSNGPAETILQIIREDSLDMRVMLGVWIAVSERRDDSGNMTERFPEAVASNQREIETGIRLANEYPEIVIAVSVGNETQVFWSAHRSPAVILVQYVRDVRKGTTVPVTVADDFNFWNKPESHVVANEIDFIVMHAHPLWNGLQLEDALDWTKGIIGEIKAEHPDHEIILGETGWATQRHSEGEQATLMKGVLGEAQQKFFYDTFSEWAARERFVTFFFEAFDENWKGGAHPDEVEKHWGLFRANRTPKEVFTGDQSAVD